MKRHLCLGVLLLALMSLRGVTKVPGSPALFNLGNPVFFAHGADSLLRTFELVPHPEGTRLSWRAPHIEGAVYFFVERSTNGEDFELIGGVAADTLREWSDYQLADRLRTFGAVRSFDYRIEVWFKDGSTLTTTPRRVYPYQAERLRVISNPAAGEVRLRFEGEIQPQKNYSLEVYSLQGNFIQKIEISAQQLHGEDPLPLPVRQSGIYFFRLHDGRQTWFGRSRL